MAESRCSPPMLSITGGLSALLKNPNAPCVALGPSTRPGGRGWLPARGSQLR